MHTIKHNIVRSLFVLTALFAAAFAGTTLRADTSAVLTAPSQFSVSLISVYESKVVEQGQLLDPRANSVNDIGLGFDGLSIDTVLYAPTEISTHAFHSRLDRVDLIGALEVLKTNVVDATVGYQYKQFDYLPNRFSRDTQSEPFVKLSSAYLPLPVYVITRYDIPTRTTNVEGGAGYAFGLPLGLTLTPTTYVGYADVANEYPHTLRAIAGWSRYHGGSISLTHSLLGGTVGASINDNLADSTYSDTARWYTISYGIKL